MRLVINGREEEIPVLTTVGELLRHLELLGQRVAVERNGTVIRRSDLEQTPLEEGDRLEIVRFVGGGSR